MERRKSVRMETIAKELGVSVVTVSNALNGRKGVSEEKRRRIVARAQELGYSASEHEPVMKKKDCLIGCIVASRFVQEFPSFYMEIYKNIAREAGKRGCMTVLEVVTSEMENHARSFPAFQETGIGGILLIGEMKRTYVDHVKKQYPYLPVVCVDDYDVREDIDYIVTDSFGGMERMTHLLLQQGLTDLVFVGTVGATDSITDRYLGFCKALERRGITSNLHEVIPDRDGGRLFPPKLPKHLPQGFVCNCDKTAFEVIRMLRGRGIRVPEDVSVVGFDDFPRETAEHIRLATYRNDAKLIAQLSLHIMINRLEEKDRSCGVRVVEGTVVRGESVKYRRQGTNGGG